MIARLFIRSQGVFQIMANKQAEVSIRNDVNSATLAHVCQVQKVLHDFGTSDYCQPCVLSYHTMLFDHYQQ